MLLLPRSFQLVLLSLALALVLAPAASAAPGDLDPSFGSGGSVRLLPSNEAIALRAVAVQPDSKIVLAGGDNTTQSVVLVRLLPNGDLDPSFGNGGIATTLFPGGYGEARAIALQPDGKIVVAGGAKGATDTDFLIARYNTDGSPDKGFGGGDGIQVLAIGPSHDTAEAVAIGPTGQILATGRSDLGASKTGAAVAVLKSDGEPEPLFASGGTTIVDTTADDSDKGVAIAELSGGRVLLADSTGNGAGDGFTLVRLLASGLPDPEFGGGDGIVNTPIPGTAAAEGRVEDFAVRTDGRIVAARGTATRPSARRRRTNPSSRRSATSKTATSTRALPVRGSSVATSVPPATPPRWSSRRRTASSSWPATTTPSRATLQPRSCGSTR